MQMVEVANTRVSQPDDQSGLKKSTTKSRQRAFYTIILHLFCTKQKHFTQYPHMASMLATYIRIYPETNKT